MAELLKDLFFKDEFIFELSDSIKEVYSDFNDKEFKIILQNKKAENLELKQKMRYVSEKLHEYLPQNYEDALLVLLKICHRFSGFNAMVFADFVDCYGQNYYDVSIKALEEFTKSGSAEFAIRPFLQSDLLNTVKIMTEWSENENADVRRLASEGCRPRLPWGMAVSKIKEDPELIIPILQNLKDDPSETVRRSVANNLNDISKDHPEICLKICEIWLKENKNRIKLVKHACRGLLKKGNKRALELFGYKNADKIDVLNLKLDTEHGKVKIGSKMNFQFEINIPESTLVRLEYAVYFKMKNKQFSKKVFHIKEGHVTKGIHLISKNLMLKEYTTRKLYTGLHKFSVIVNGIEKKTAEFELVMV